MVNGFFMAAMAVRPVWLRYSTYQTWHCIKGDVQIMTDLHKPCCEWQGGSLVISGVTLVPTENMRICTSCLMHSLNVADWELEG